EDAQGRIWVGGYDGGLNLFEPGTESWKHYEQERSPQPGMMNARVNCVTHDDQGYVWMSLMTSIWRFDPASETSVGFWSVEGVQSGGFVPDNCSRSPGGELFFGGQLGFTAVKPDLIPAGPQPTVAVITVVGVSGVVLRPGLDPRLPAPLSRTDFVRLDHDENNLLFEYAGIDFGHAVQRMFAYRLEPLEDLWQQAGTRQSVAYANLDPGEYRFMVRFWAAGRMSNTASIRIIITPPWWETWPAFMLFGSMGMGVLYGGYRYRVRRLRAYSRRLEQEVVQRTRDLEEEKRKTEEQAERLLELDHVKNEFFANISHEFRTPLTLVVGPLQDAIEGAFDDDRDELRRQHSVMLASARRLLRLINQLLDLSKLESGKLELHTQPGDLVRFLRRLTRSFAPSAERRGVSFRFQSDVESLPCLFDEDKLEKIVSNLVSNAFKFTPSGGKVAVEVKSQRNEEATHVELAVKDTGRGIAKEDLGRVFDRFQQADTSTTREYEGTGIGLSLARELTELHGGTISVESQVGFGSTFRVEIQLRNVPADLVSERPVSGPDAEEPADLVDADAKPEIDADAASGNGRHEVILIVEDNADVRHYVKSHLASHFQVIEAENGEMGLTAAREHPPDLILADVMMPKMDGYEMVRRIREIESLRHVPIVMLTAKAGEQEAIEGIEAGADDYVSKPFRFGELETRIASLIRKRREMRERFSDEVVIKGSDIVVTSDDAAFLGRVTTIVDEHLGHANFGGDWLADEVGLSRRQLERKMETILGESPAALIRRLRLERASQLLRARAGTVAEIAYSVGFTNPAYFARAFKKAFGESPSEHRGE
ncbi:MAG TPA: ATP-binding protein, partial [Rhodothermia bacterium]